MNLDRLETERRNPDTQNLDMLSAYDLVSVIQREDAKVAAAVRQALPSIAAAVDVIVESLRSGGRLFYIGAGTSGRLGVLDAAECPPTFNTSPDTVQALIAGGEGAMFRAVEGAEDNEELSAKFIGWRCGGRFGGQRANPLCVGRVAICSGSGVSNHCDRMCVRR